MCVNPFTKKKIKINQCHSRFGNFAVQIYENKLYE